MITQQSVSSVETILVIQGPLFGEAVNEFHARMQEVSAGRSLTITLDLSQVPNMSSQALGKLLFFRMRLNENGKALRIRGCSDGLLKMLRMLRLETLIEMAK